MVSGVNKVILVGRLGKDPEVRHTNNGGKIALSIIILSFILLAVANWGWKKYFSNKNEVSQEK